MSGNSSDLYRDWAEAQNLLQQYTDWGRTDDVLFYVHQANEQDGKILEIGCGTGSIHLEILQQDNDIHGLDSSEAQLDILV